MLGLPRRRIPLFNQALFCCFLVCILELAAFLYFVLRRLVAENEDAVRSLAVPLLDGPAASLAMIKYRPMWNCAYYDNPQGSGSPLASLTMDHLASDWQEKPGWGYDGPPILNYTKSGFYLKCHIQKEFQRGSYKMIPYLKCDSFKLRVDGKEIYFREGHLQRFDDRHNLVDLEALHFNSTEAHNIEVTVGVVKPSRSWFVFSISRIYSYARSTLDNNHMAAEQPLLSPNEKIACGATPDCHGPPTTCQNRDTKGLEIGEAPWGLCLDFLPTQQRCLVYSFGVRDIYKAELLYGQHGCEVHAFDCTINHSTTLGPNVTFHPWCLGSNSSELKLDGKLSNAMGQAQKGEFLKLPAIVERLGHTSSDLTILKMDCEGCEWNGLDVLTRDMPAFFAKIRMLHLELHFVTDAAPGTSERATELETMSRVMDRLRDYRTFGYSINSDLSIERFGNPIFYDELYDVGLFAAACCYEFSMVRKDLVPVMAL